MLRHRFSKSEFPHPPRAAVLWLSVVALAAAVALGEAGEGALAAKPITVCTSGCDFTNLQAAIGAVHAGGTIHVAAGIYAGGLTIDKSLRLVGAGTGETTIDGGSPVVSVSPAADVTIMGVTITSSGRDGGINNGGVLSLRDTTIRGILKLEDPLEGAGVYNTGTLTLQGSTLDANAAGSKGGAIYNDGGVVTVQNSTLSNNRAEDGGGIFTVGGTVTVKNSVVTGNRAADGGSGGGILKAAGGFLDVRDSTISGNSAQGFGGGIYSADNQLTVRGTMISGNRAVQCGGGIVFWGALDSVLRDDTISGNSARAFEDNFNPQPPTDSCLGAQISPLFT
jgi:nitrous oxidase accessory protein NosD